ncbi:MAG: hypothetical protein AB7D39_06380 [Pseudodesulfovibrio sp.]|uniref:hypothetical protein n=1 Tax=Pseudodesulfovibrio sp. TaxID=2035812 RepID=UPI003D0AA05C
MAYVMLAVIIFVGWAIMTSFNNSSAKTKLTAKIAEKQGVSKEEIDEIMGKRELDGSDIP